MLPYAMSGWTDAESPVVRARRARPKRSGLRPREIRDMTVPIGMSSNSAVSTQVHIGVAQGLPWSKSGSPLPPKPERPSRGRRTRALPATPTTAIFSLAIPRSRRSRSAGRCSRRPPLMSETRGIRQRRMPAAAQLVTSVESLHAAQGDLCCRCTLCSRVPALRRCETAISLLAAIRRTRANHSWSKYLRSE
jgi:hypothetical protein